MILICLGKNYLLLWGSPGNKRPSWLKHNEDRVNVYRCDFWSASASTQEKM